MPHGKKWPCSDRNRDDDVSEEDESYKENRRNYGKANIDDLEKLYDEINWEKLKRANDVQDKYDIFMKLYETGVDKYVPLNKPKEKRKTGVVQCKMCKCKEKKRQSMEKNENKSKPKK